MRTAVLGFIILLVTFSISAQPSIIAHRGASGYLPEHTLEAATLAFMQGADYIEQDLVLSKDGQLVVLHDIHLEQVTDVDTRFPARSREDGRFYAIDFTLAELKTLRVHERHDNQGKPFFPGRYQGNGHFTLATFDEQRELIDNLNRQLGRQVGLYPEIKSPAWHRAQGQDISRIFINKLDEAGLNNPDSNLIVQCFDFTETRRLRQQLGLKTRLVQLIGDNSWEESDTDYNYLLSPAGLTEISKVADGIGPWLPQLMDVQTFQPTSLIKDAKAQGLLVHPYTFRLEQLPKGLSHGQVLDLLFKQLKVDGLFTDFTDVVADHLK